MTIANAHPNEDVEERLKIVPISVALALEYLNCHELHGASPMTSSTRHTVQFLRQVKINQYPPFLGPSTSKFYDDDIIGGNISVKNLPILKQRPMSRNSIKQNL